MCLTPSVSDSTSYIFLEICSVLMERNILGRQMGGEAQSVKFCNQLIILYIKERTNHVS